MGTPHFSFLWNIWTVFRLPPLYVLLVEPVLNVLKEKSLYIHHIGMAGLDFMLGRREFWQSMNLVKGVSR